MAPNVSLTSQNNIAKLNIDIKADMRFGDDNGNFSIDDLNINKDEIDFLVEGLSSAISRIEKEL